MADLKAEIVREIYIALEGLAADPMLLGIVGSWGDTMNDEQVLADLKSFNRSGTIFDERIEFPKKD